MEGYIDLKRLNLDELVGVVNLYPWFGGARKELCARMSRMGEVLSDSQYAEAAMYVASREKIASLRKSSVSADWTDGDVEKLLKSYISEQAPAVAQPLRHCECHRLGGQQSQSRSHRLCEGAVRRAGRERLARRAIHRGVWLLRLQYEKLVISSE